MCVICKISRFSISLLLMIFIFKSHSANAQSLSQQHYGINDTIISVAVIYEGDTIEAKTLAGVYIWGKRAKAEWTRLRNAIYVTYPYAKRAGYVFSDIERHIANTTCLLYTSPSPRDRQKSR